MDRGIASGSGGPGEHSRGGEHIYSDVAAGCCEPMNTRRFAVPALAAILVALNLYFCHELFGIQYLDNFQSNEGILVTLAKFFGAHPGAKWFPLWNIGLPVENTYEPVMPAAIALLSRVTPLSPPLALHVLCAAFFCLIPALWFWLLWRWGVSAPCAFVAGLIYSLVSPSLF